MGKFVKLIKAGYMEGVSEPWCNDQGVAILPFIYQYNQYWFLLIHETNPLLNGKLHQSYGTLTGGCELKKDILTTVKDELIEETGINIKDKNNDKATIYNLGSYYANKTNIKIWHLFAIDLSDLELNLQETYYGKGDGSIGEKGIRGVFVNEFDLDKSNDTLALAIYAKLKIENILEDNSK